MRRLQQWFIGWLCMGLAACLPAVAQTKLDNAQLDQLMAPVALYPDSLLSQILMGATYPDDVAAAAKWSAAHTSESGDQAVKAVEGEAWDPSVKSLVAFPSVMDMMGRQPDWVKSVGDAFLAQPDAVMDSVQRLRVQAQKAGNLKSTPQQKVTSSTTNDKTVVVIEPADPQVVYVPSYNPSVVYGTWAYPSYPPYYYPPPPGSVFATSLVAGLSFGLGVAAVNSMWGGFDWGHNDVDIDVNRYNHINVNRRLDARSNNVTWNHDPARRGATPYRNSATRQRYDAQRRVGATAHRPSADQARRDHAQQVMHDRRPAADGARAGAGARTAQHRPEAARPAAHNAPRQRNDARNAAIERSRSANRDNALRGVDRPAPTRHASARGNDRPAAHSAGRAGPGAGAHSSGRAGRSGGAHIERGHGRR